MLTQQMTICRMLRNAGTDAPTIVWWNAQSSEPLPVLEERLRRSMMGTDVASSRTTRSADKEDHEVTRMRVQCGTLFSLPGLRALYS
jgi:chlorite dismutase